MESKSKLNEITTQYNTFVDNQVLTSSQLNQFIGYFDDQDRISRVLLSGTGIVCGFSITVNGSKTALTISQGVGVTTDGDLISLQKSIPYSTSKSIDFKSITYTHFLKFDDKDAEYPLFRKTVNLEGEATEVQMNLIELFPEYVDNSDSIKPETLLNKVVLLYLESYPSKAGICTQLTCDNQGEEQVARLRVLLVSLQDAQLISSNDSVFSKHDLYKKFLHLPEVSIKRVIFSEGSANTAQQIRNAYSSAILSGTTLTDLRRGFDELNSLFGYSSITPSINSIFSFTSSNIPNDIQYRYDVLRDLIDTYNEAKELLLHTNVQCFPDITAFPKHLMLGKVTEDGAYKSFRHRLYKSPGTGNEANNLAKLKNILGRARIQAASFWKNATAPDIKIIPSSMGGELSNRAIPFYYRKSSEISSFWNHNRIINLNKPANFWYHSIDPFTPTSIKNPLAFDISSYGFFRVEGHQSMDYNLAVSRMMQLIKVYGLDFEFIHFDLSSEGQQFQMLAKNEPSLEHLAGVPRGGTFIMLADKGKVIADFALPYRYKKEKEVYSRTIMECTYPWISSLKYLNNLARGIGGTRSRRLQMPQNYLLQVIYYQINDTIVSSGFVTISVPLKQILLRRMHAVTEALNLKFPEGLVFDFNESQKRLVIVYAKGDNFKIRFRDVTLSPNAPIYEFTNSKVFKSNKLLRSSVVICREIIRYNKDYYKMLHNEFAPVNKDDDYGLFRDKWAEWESLVSKLKKDDRKRVVRTISDLPSDIKRIIDELKRDIRAINDTAKIWLDGDWVNGTWVDNAMLKYYFANRNSADDQVVRFIKLKEFLHSKTGVSKLSIYLPNVVYSADFDAIIEKQSQHVDLFFSTPTGKHAKEII